MNPIINDFYQNPYQGYLYSYPHKTAYRPVKPVSLKKIWQNENKDSLFLYLHIPFCASKCGFCNLLSLKPQNSELVDAYIKQLALQAEVTTAYLGNVHFSHLALGGGTPSFLSEKQLNELLAIPQKLKVDMQNVFTSVEVSPITLNQNKLTILKESYTNRISIGIQSFVNSENRAIARNHPIQNYYASLELIKKIGFPILNIDLIYGIPGQTLKSWQYSLKEALKFQPHEIYLYPFYLREYTPLGKKYSKLDLKLMMQCYKVGREMLQNNNYNQLSLRMFQAHTHPHPEKPQYTCQEDGMIGLGCGARSYTSSFHYASPFAVNYDSINKEIQHYINQSKDELAIAQNGFFLDENEQKKRYVIKSFFKKEGIALKNYENYFKTSVKQDFKQLDLLIDAHLANETDDLISLTPDGLALSDAIGSWLISNEVKQKMQKYIYL